MVDWVARGVNPEGTRGEVERGALDSPRQVKDGEDNVGVVEERGAQDTPWLVKYVGEDVVEVERGALDSPRQVK